MELIYRLYYYSILIQGKKVYFDDEMYSYQAVVFNARQYAMEHEDRRIYIENSMTGLDEGSYLFVNGKISTELY